MKKEKNMTSKKIIIGLSISLALLIIIAGILFIGILKDVLGNNRAEEVEIVDTIDTYEYKLTENNTDYFESLYYELKDELALEVKNDDKYAELVTKLFIADFYDLNSKLNKNDIGGVQFIYDKYQSTFIKSANDINGIYYYVDNNIYGEREQELPIVKDVSVEETLKINYTYGDINDSNAYQIKVYITYEEDLGYPKNATVTLVHNNDKIEIVKVN